MSQALSRQEQKHLTRQTIIRTAAKLFSEEGLGTTKTGAIAQGAGISHGSIFVHFPTRDELVTAVVEEIGGQIANRVRQLTSQGASVREVLAGHLDGLMEYESFYTRLVLEGPFLPSSARRVMVEIQSAIASHLEEVMEEEISEGKIRRLPLHLAFNTWIGLIHHYLSNADLFAPGGSVLKKWGKKLLNHYMELLTK
jgi:AcrR family transcriptional regulator